MRKPLAAKSEETREYWLEQLADEGSTYAEADIVDKEKSTWHDSAIIIEELRCKIRFDWMMPNNIDKLDLYVRELGMLGVIEDKPKSDKPMCHQIAGWQYCVQGGWYQKLSSLMKDSGHQTAIQQ